MKEPTLRRGRAVAWLPLVMTLLWGAGATQAEAQHVHRHSSSVEGYFIADFLVSGADGLARIACNFWMAVSALVYSCAG